MISDTVLSNTTAGLVRDSCARLHHAFVRNFGEDVSRSPDNLLPAQANGGGFFVVNSCQLTNVTVQGASAAQVRSTPAPSLQAVLSRAALPTAIALAPTAAGRWRRHLQGWHLLQGHHHWRPGGAGVRPALTPIIRTAKGSAYAAAIESCSRGIGSAALSFTLLLQEGGGLRLSGPFSLNTSSFIDCSAGVAGGGLSFGPLPSSPSDAGSAAGAALLNGTITGSVFMNCSLTGSAPRGGAPHV